AGVAVLPVLAAIWLSLHRSILVFHEERFIGIANFRFLFSDGRFWSALGTTAYFTAVAVAAELLIGLPVAMLLQRGGGFFRAAILLPWAIPTAVSARMWAWLFNADYGLLHRLLPARRRPGERHRDAFDLRLQAAAPLRRLRVRVGALGRDFRLRPRHRPRLPSLPRTRAMKRLPVLVFFLGPLAWQVLTSFWP